MGKLKWNDASYRRWYPNSHHSVKSVGDGTAISACGINVDAYAGASFHKGEVTCENCKRTHRYKNDLLTRELTS